MVSFPQVSLPKPCTNFSSIRATYPAHLILPDLITRTILGEYRSLSSSLWSFLHSCYLVPLIPKYSPQHHILKPPQPTFLSQCERPSFKPIQNNRKILVLYVLIFKFLDRKLEDNKHCVEWYQAFPDLNLILISSRIEFWHVKFVPKYLNSSTLSKELVSVFILWLRPAF